MNKVVQFLHSIGATCTTYAMDWAAQSGHLEVLQFLHSIGATYVDAINLAAHNGHQNVVDFLSQL